MPKIILATNTGTNDFKKSKQIHIAPYLGPNALNTLVPPTFPLPTFLISTPFNQGTIKLKGKEPHT